MSTDEHATAADWGVADLTVRFTAVVALDGVELTVPPGIVTAVVGGDGAGKTTLLRVLAGVQAPSAGRVRCPPSRRIGFVAAGAGVYDDLTVTENIQFAGGAYGMRGAALDAGATPLLSRTHLDDVRDRLAGKLSGGMRQKLAFVLAMLHEPGLLILDEPTTGVDPVSRAELWRLIAAAAAGGTAVVLATTYLDEAERAARVLLLDEGRVLAAGSTRADHRRPAGDGGRGGRGAGRRRRLAPRPRLAAVAARRRPGRHRRTRGAPRHARLRRRGDRRFTGAPRRRRGDRAHERRRTGQHRCARVAGRGAAGRDARGDAAVRFVHGRRRGRSARRVRPGRGPAGRQRRRQDDPHPSAARPAAPDRRRGAAVRRAALAGHAPPPRLRAPEPRRLGRPYSRREPAVLGRGLRRDGPPAGGATGGGPTSAAAADAALAAHGRTLAGDLPLGLRRRLAFAAALSHLPELLVLDEPTSGVAALARARLWDTIRAAADTGAGVLVTTHSLDEAEQCDRLVLMAAGRVVAAGTIAQIVGGATAVEVDCPRWDDAFRALDAAGLPLVLAGRRLRVPGGDVARVQAALDARHVAARLRVVAATFEETFVQITTQATAAASHDPAAEPPRDPTNAQTRSTV